LRAVGECNNATGAGSNLTDNLTDVASLRPGRRHIVAHVRRGRGRRFSPYTARLVTRRPWLGCLFEIVETLVLTLIIFLVIQNFVAQPYKVQQQSMEHTLEPDQYVLVDKLTPRFDIYQRGDIVVFTPPQDWVDSDGTPFIKRVIGVGEDEVEIIDGLVYVNGTQLDEPYLYADVPGGPARPTTATQDRWVVPADEVFLMGDNRANSADSRSFGPVPVANVIGRAWLRYWPVDTFGILPAPTYPELESAGP
jgi:signal peptidase I